MNRLGKLFLMLLTLTGLGASSGNAFAAIKTSVAAGGNWSAAATWSPSGVPAAGDTVTIAGPGSVTVDVTVTQTAAGSVTVNSGVTLTATTGGTTVTFGALTINSTGILSTSRVLTVLGATNITGTINFQSTARADVFTGDVTLNSGAVWNEAIAITPTFSGNLTNNATTFTASTGAHTFNGATKTLSGATTTSIPSVTMTGTYTNNGTLTVGTALSGAGGLTNGATSVLNIGGTSGITTLTATAAGNTVNYTGAAQTVKATAYSNLGLSGSNVKTMPTGITVAGNFTISGTANATPAAAGTLAVGGNWSNGGTFTAGTSTVTLNGANSTLGGSATTTFNNLIINKTTGNVTVTSTSSALSPTVNGTLTLTNGDVITTVGTNDIGLGTAGTVSGGSATSYVQGAVRKNYAANSALTFTFPVGDASNYTPVAITGTANTTTAGNLTISTTGSDHPSIGSSGIDATHSVNRYWTLTVSGLSAGATYSASFQFCSATGTGCGVNDVDAGASIPFIVEQYSTGWFPTTVSGCATTTPTTQCTITGETGFGDFAIGDPLSGFSTVPGRFNAFESATPAASLLGRIYTKVAGTAFALDIVSINATKTAYGGAVTPVTVQLLNSSNSSAALDANGCRSTWTVVGTPITTTLSIPAGGRVTLSGITVNQVYSDARLYITGAGLIGCSTDRFAIRPASISLSATDATWNTAGPGRTLNNTGGIVHAAGQPFTLTVSPQPVTATNYNTTSFTVTSGYPSCLLPASCPPGTLGTLTQGTFSAAGSGVQQSSTASYAEVGAINLQLEDDSFAAVDALDGTPSTCSNSAPIGLNTCSTATIAIGRFVPDHFDVSTANTPQFQTFGASCAGTRSFTYIGQPFNYTTRPQATIYARNAAGATTANYTGTLWKIGGASPSTAKNCLTSPDPNTCQFTTSWSAGGNSSSVIESYTYALTPVSTPNWDNAGATAAAASVAAGAGTGTITYASSDTLAFLRNTTTPQVTFTASITDTISVQDTSESAVTGNGTIATTTAAAFSSIGFDSGNGFRFGRLRLENANGSELIAMPIPMRVQYWNGSNFVTNTADNCTRITPSYIAIGNPQPVSFTIGTPTVGGAFVAGIGSLRLPAPSSDVRGSVDVAVNLTNTTTSASCSAAVLTSSAGANMAYLQGAWCGATYVKDPTARATFGTYRNSDQFIFQQENY